MEYTLVFVRVLVVILFVKWQSIIGGSDKVLGGELTDDDLFVVGCIFGLGKVFLQVSGTYFYVRKLLEHLNGALSNSASASDSKHNWRQLLGDASGEDLVTQHFESILHGPIVRVHVGAPNQEWSLELLLQQEFSNSSNEIKSTCNACIPSKRHESLRESAWHLRLSNALKVNHSDV